VLYVQAAYDRLAALIAQAAIKYFMTSPSSRFGIDYRMALLDRSYRIVSCRLLWFLCNVILFVVPQILLRLL
jgi:hypothetical protein